MAEPKHVVILGAGFAGIGALKKLRDADVRITIVDKRDYHTFQPLLYQVATDELGPTEVGFPIRELLHGHKNITYPSGRSQKRRSGAEAGRDGQRRSDSSTTIWSWLWARWLTSITRPAPTNTRSRFTRWKMPFASRSTS